MVRKRYPEYQLAADHISYYQDMTLVTFAVNRKIHVLVVSFPVFVKDYQRSSLAIFKIKTVPVPIPEKNNRGVSYTKVNVHKPYIAAGDDIIYSGV